MSGMIIIIAGLAVFYYQWLKAYYDEFENNHYKSGDSIHANSRFTGDAKKLSITILKFADKSDNTPDADFPKLAGYIFNQRLIKANTDVIGTYLYTKMVAYRFKGESGVMRMYAIAPNWKVTDTSGMSIVVRGGYSKIDTNYYILTDLPFFK